MIRVALALVAASCAGPATPAPPPPRSPPPTTAVATEPRPLLPALETWRAERPRRTALGYLKGATHVHTRHSGDSSLWPRDVIRWYDRAGFDFVVITDHNRIADPVTGELEGTDILVLPGIELTNNPPRCSPPPPAERGRCRIHVNALFLRNFSSHSPDERPIRHDWRARGTIERVDLYQAAIDFSRARGGLIQINHPTWHWGTDGALLAELGRRGVALVEIANTSFETWNAGTAEHPGTEAIWDAALSAGVLVWGVASDDAHHYRERVITARETAGDKVYRPGGGFVMVRARRGQASIRAAMARGDFYSSTGVLLERAEVVGAELVVEVAASESRPTTIRFIGDGGELLAETRGRSARFPLARAKSYVRAVVGEPGGQRAWVQPAFRPGPTPARSSPRPARSQTR